MFSDVAGGLRGNLVLPSDDTEGVKMKSTDQNRHPTTSVAFAIGMLDLTQSKAERQWVSIPVRSHVGDTPVTLEMVKAQVGIMNINTGLHGRTSKKIARRVSYCVQTLK